MKGQEPFDLVTVIFGGEIGLLRLQAASIARFVPEDLIRRIYLIVNDVDEEGCLERVRGILPHYGSLTDRVEIVRPDRLFAPRPAFGGGRGLGAALRLWFTRNRTLYPLGRKGGWRGNRGWSMQQALKLASARVVQAPFVLILDAKNHFVREVSSDSFISGAGRARSRFVVPSEKLNRWIAASFRRLGLEPPDRSEPAPPATTPFCVESAILRDCLDDVEAAAGPVEALFARKRTPESEFMLIYASVIRRHGSWRKVFDMGLRPPAGIGRSGPTETALAAVEDGAVEVFALHRARIPALTPSERARLEAIWRERDLPRL